MPIFWYFKCQYWGLTFMKWTPGGTGGGLNTYIMSSVAFGDTWTKLLTFT